MIVIATITSKVTVLFVRQRNAYLEALISPKNPAVVILHDRAIILRRRWFLLQPFQHLSVRGRRMDQDPAGG